MRYFRKIAVVFIAILLFSCESESFTPKPKGYFRIDLPEKKYEQTILDCPFTFEKPTYTVIKMVEQADKPCWFNLDFTTLQASLYFSYNKIENNLNQYLDDSRTLAFKHSVKAIDIEQIVINYPQKKVYGLIYDIKGNAASEFQFHLTDSVNHFLVGSLYFNTPPNQDSIQPVLDFVKQDIEHLFSTFEWKK